MKISSLCISLLLAQGVSASAQSFSLGQLFGGAAPGANMTHPQPVAKAYTQGGAAAGGSVLRGRVKVSRCKRDQRGIETCSAASSGGACSISLDWSTGRATFTIPALGTLSSLVPDRAQVYYLGGGPQEFPLKEGLGYLNRGRLRATRSGHAIWGEIYVNDDTTGNSYTQYHCQ